MKANSTQIIKEIVKAMLLLMWVYALASKLMSPAETRAQLNNQIFDSATASALFYIIPILESIVILLLLTKITRIAGYLSSTLLLFVFTAYIILIKLSYFDRIPCSCGGVISGFSWTQHLLFNSLFLTLSMIGLLLTIKERRTNGKAP